MPENMEELRAKAKASAIREREAAKRKQARLEQAAQEAIAKWLAGESVSIPHGVSRTYLRVIQAAPDAVLDTVVLSFMETSRGARVPLGDAQKAYRFACLMLKRGGWRRNGEQFKVGDYHLDAVNEQGIIAGCHRIDWQEAERFACSQGWTKGHAELEVQQ
jgi:hypothetical protein